MSCLGLLHRTLFRIYIGLPHGVKSSLDSQLHPMHRKFQATGHDLHSLLFSFLDELLFVFNTEFFVCQTLSITSLDLEGYALEAEG